MMVSQLYFVDPVLCLNIYYNPEYIRHSVTLFSKRNGMSCLKMLYYNFIYKLVSELPFTAIGNVFNTCFMLTIKFKITLK
jgi:hypothetical protein